MSLENHLHSLERKHEALEDSIKAEEQRPSSDSFALQNMKKAKLAIKEEMEQIRHKTGQPA